MKEKGETYSVPCSSVLVVVPPFLSFDRVTAASFLPCTSTSTEVAVALVGDAPSRLAAVTFGVALFCVLSGPPKLGRLFITA